MKTLPKLLLLVGLLAPAALLGQVAPTATPPAPAPATPQKGDVFYVGDRVQLQVEGDTTLSGTFIVGTGPAINLPVIGTISLAGVSRSNVEPYLTEQISHYLKHPVVHAQTLIHLSIIGEVERPGYYTVPVDMLLGDVLMQAGGPTRDANVPAITIKRTSQLLYQADSTRRTPISGQTVDQLGLRDGDIITVPRLVRADPEATWRIVGIVVMSAVAIVTLTRWH